MLLDAQFTDSSGCETALLVSARQNGAGSRPGVVATAVVKKSGTARIRTGVTGTQGPKDTKLPYGPTS